MSYAVDNNEEISNSSRSVSSLWLSRILPGLTLSLFAVIASSLTLFSNIKSLLQLSPWIEYIVNLWSDLMLMFWDWVAGLGGATVELGEASVLTITLLLTIAAISARIQKPGLGIELSEIIFRLLFCITFFALALTTNYFLGQQVDQSFTTGVSLTVILAVGLTIFSRREENSWFLSIFNAVILVFILLFIYGLIFLQIRSSPEVLSVDNWSIVVALLSPIVPISLSKIYLLRNRLLFVLIGVFVLFIISEITFLIV